MGAKLVISNHDLLIINPQGPFVTPAA